jgi:hypothetical protein
MAHCFREIHVLLLLDESDGITTFAAKQCHVFRAGLI